jgi:hypothetical protein
MTAINVLKQKAAVHVMTDGAHYAANGMLVGIAPKIYPLPHLRAAVATRGSKAMHIMGPDALGNCFETYDELKLSAVDRMRDIVGMLDEIFKATAFGSDFDLIVAGWSESSGPDSYLVCNHARHGQPPWTVVELGAFSLTPSDASIHAKVFAGFPKDAGADDLDPDLEAVRVLQIQRSALLPCGPDDVPMHTVGGFAEITTITERSIESRVVHRWPEDRIGERIDAEACSVRSNTADSPPQNRGSQ